MTARSRLLNRKKQKLTNKRNLVPKGWVIKLSCVRCHTEMKEVTWSRHVNKTCAVFRALDEKIETRLQVADNMEAPDSFAVSANKKPTWRCPKCDRAINSLVARELHRCSQLDPADFPFTLLPAGEKDCETAFSKTYGAIRQRRRVSLDWERIRKIESLQPIARHFGKEGWFGYGAFEFAYSELIVLETPLAGNATYLLGADWREAISLAKAEVRSNYRGKYFRVIHRGGWGEASRHPPKRTSISISL